MARQAGEILVTGTVYGVCHYQMNGKYYARLKSSLTRRQFKRNKCFENSRRSAAQVGAASSIAAQIYRQVPKDQKSRALFQKMVGEVKRMISQGIAEETIFRKCREAYLPGATPHVPWNKQSKSGLVFYRQLTKEREIERCCPQVVSRIKRLKIIRNVFEDPSTLLYEVLQHQHSKI